MIITLISVVILVVGISLLKYSDEAFNWDFCFAGGLITTIIGATGVIVATIAIIGAHVNVDVEVEQVRIKQEQMYDALEKLASTSNDEFNNSRTIVEYAAIKRDIAEWNMEVISDKKWCNSLWTNWFYSKKVVDAKDIIE